MQRHKYKVYLCKKIRSKDAW